ncbi:MAG: N-acetylmuramoyl-L-alanine amidase [Deltaproteobacteria bacterium]|nr:N-acetylmuramoyl-L-alanine amidase [Deltaproteobacteria bacterium]
MMPRRFICFPLFALWLFFHCCSCAYGVDTITAVRFWSAPDHTRVVLDFKGGKPAYKQFSLANPGRLVMDFENAVIALEKNKIEVNDGIIAQVRFGQHEKDRARMVFDLVQPAEASVFTSEKNHANTQRLVIEIFRADLQAQAKKTRAQISASAGNDRVIVIDPGHGGEDPGAIGPGRMQEKDIVLKFAHSLKKKFSEMEGYQAFLTREGDYFIPLRERIQIAREYGADLFISIHADSNHNHKIRGSSVYCLSLKGASDETARCLAEKENSSDIIGGIAFTQNDDLNFTLLDLALTNTINSSLRFGALVLKEIKKYHLIKFERPKQAGFIVLKTPEAPSILIELGFISNPSEEKLLLQKKFQNNLARAIVDASDRFFRITAGTDETPHEMATLRRSRMPITADNP